MVYSSHVGLFLQVLMASRSVTRRMSYTAGFKLEVAAFAENSGNRSAGRKYGVNEKLVRDWRKQQPELKAQPTTARSNRVGRKPYWPDLEDKLAEWVLDKRLNGIGLSGTMIRLKAKQMAKEMDPTTVEGFSGCTSWLYRFMKRKGLVVRQKTKIAQRLPEEFEDKIISFQRMMIEMRKKNDYELQQIGNMDETPMNFDMPPSRTVNPIGEKTVLITTTENEKKHFTVILACMADGSKLMPMIIILFKVTVYSVLINIHNKQYYLLELLQRHK